MLGSNWEEGHSDFLLGRWEAFPNGKTFPAMQRPWGTVFQAQGTNPKCKGPQATGFGASMQQKPGYHGWSTVPGDEGHVVRGGGSRHHPD